MAYEAYWAVLDWKALAAFAGGIGTLASPFIVEWWKGKAASRETAAQVAETVAQRVERQNKENYENLRQEREYHAEQAQKAAARVEAAQEEASERRREGRAMEDWAHWYRHGWLNANARFTVLVEINERFFSGAVTRQGLLEIIRNIRASMPVEPDPVPLLQDAPAQKPPR